MKTGYAVKQSKRFTVLQITQSRWKFLPDECQEMAASVLAEAMKRLPEFGEEVEISFEIRTPQSVKHPGLGENILCANEIARGK